MATYARGYDLGSSISKTADYTTSVKLCRTDNGVYIIEDYFRYKKNTADVEKLILETAAKDGINVKIVLPLEPAAAGAAQQMYLTRALDGWKFEFAKQTKTKAERAYGISSQVLNGNVRIVRNKYYNDFINELEAFTDNPKEYLHDDWVDSLAMAYNSMLKPRAVYRDIPMEKQERWGDLGDEDNFNWRK
jgi:predicted phage terminase large subunit-like protein